MNPDLARLPFIDEHDVLVAASADSVWHLLGASLGSSGSVARLLVTLLAAVPSSRSGDSLSQGATMPGFDVAEAVPGDRLVLAGRHRFSEYALIFVLADEPGGTRLSALTHARFPGIRGELYRTAVIRSGAHRVLVMRLLRGIRRAAEHPR
jgi:hypothetical protein